MDNSRTLFALAPIFIMLVCTILLVANGNPVYIADRYKYVTNSSYKLDCNPVEYSEKDVIIFNNNDLFLKSKKLIINSKNYLKENKKFFICPRFVNISSENTTLNCKQKFGYDKSEYEILQNGSALVHGAVIPKEDYMMKDDDLLTCVIDYYDNDDDNISSSSLTLSKISIECSKIGSTISILALIIHLLTFCYLPTLRNLPGYNLASLSVAFLLAYSFLLIGQIPEVLGVFCVVSAALQQNFFLAAFFCMNVLAFDVWRTLKLATEKLMVGSQNTRRRQFLWYSLYAWGCPLLITIITVIVDNVDGVSDKIKPFYGKDDICWLANNTAKIIFFAAPAFTLFVINAIFFVRSSWIISNNTMKFPSSDHNKQDMKLNYILYVRLAIMMGLTWLIGVLALIINTKIIWFIVDILNSLQGLFLFLLFTCTRKVMKRVIEKTNSKLSTSEKHTNVSSNSSNLTTKH